MNIRTKVDKFNLTFIQNLIIFTIIARTIVNHRTISNCNQRIWCGKFLQLSNFLEFFTRNRKHFVHTKEKQLQCFWFDGAYEDSNNDISTTLTVQGIEYIDSEFRECLTKCTGHESNSIHEKSSHLDFF